MAVERLTDYTRRIWTGLSADAPDPDMQAGDVIYYMDTSTCSIITGIPAPGSIDTEDLPDVGGGGGGGWNTVDILRGTAPTGRVETTESFTTTTYSFYNRPITELFAPNVKLSASACAGCTQLTVAVIGDVSGTGVISGCTSLTAFDSLRGSVGGGQFSNDSNLTVLILRKSTVAALNNINGFANTPFASGKAGGTLYVPQALIESYQNATNWSTILAYPNNQILPIEGSIYETQYADGTPIP